jgi:hypothetical protein
MPPRRYRAEARNLRLMIETRGASPQKRGALIGESQPRVQLPA